MRFPVTIEVRRSLFFVVSLVLIHGISVLAVLGLPWTLTLRVSVLAAILLSAFLCLSRSNRIMRLTLASKTDLRCHLTDGSAHTAGILPDTTVFNQLIVLRLRLGDERKSTNLVLLPDQMSAEQFRTLRIWLRWRAPVKGASLFS